MLADNVIELKKGNQKLYEHLKRCKDETDKSCFSVEKTRDHSLTMKYVCGEKTVYLHSRYNPSKEARSKIEMLNEEDIDENTHVIFFGIGLGYQLNAFFEKYPETSFSVIEPSKEAMYHYFNNVKLEGFIKENLNNFYIEETYSEFFEKMRIEKSKNTKIIELPAYLKLFEKEYLQLLKELKNQLTNEKVLMNTILWTEKRGINSIVRNLSTILKTPNITLEHKNVFKGKTAIVVAAGPSLNNEIENLKQIKDKGLAFIFSVGSAINTLIKNKIFPDAMCTYDSSEENQNVFKKVNELEINNIPMIFGSSVGFETIEKYPGPKLHMIMVNDGISRTILKSGCKNEYELINNASSIAIVTIDLLAKLGFEKIILVGQNLGFLKNEIYADGIEVNVTKSDKLEYIEDVYGNVIETETAYLIMKKSLESMIESIRAKVINTTKGGAKIVGADFVPLEEVIENELINKIVNGNEFKNIIEFQAYCYDEAYLRKQVKAYNLAYHDYNKLLQRIKTDLKQIEKYLDANNKKKLINKYDEINEKLIKLEKNNYFNIIVRNINLFAYKKEVENRIILKKENNLVNRIKKRQESLGIFIDILSNDYQNNEYILDKLNTAVEEYSERDRH